jgi:hypothetical protein
MLQMSNTVCGKRVTRAYSHWAGHLGDNVGMQQCQHVGGSTLLISSLNRRRLPLAGALIDGSPPATSIIYRPRGGTAPVHISRLFTGLEAAYVTVLGDRASILSKQRLTQIGKTNFASLIDVVHSS